MNRLSAATDSFKICFFFVKQPLRKATEFVGGPSAPVNHACPPWHMSMYLIARRGSLPSGVLVAGFAIVFARH